MLESVRSRQLWGFLVLTVLPGKFNAFSLYSFTLSFLVHLILSFSQTASAGIGYYLRSRKDEYLLESVTPQSVNSIKGEGERDNNTKEIKDKIDLLRKREARLLLEEKELQDKLQRIRAQESERRGTGQSK